MVVVAVVVVDVGVVAVRVEVVVVVAVAVVVEVLVVGRAHRMDLLASYDGTANDPADTEGGPPDPPAFASPHTTTAPFPLTAANAEAVE